MPTYSDSNWAGGNVTIGVYVPPAPEYSDSGWVGDDVTVPNYSESSPYSDSNWVGGSVKLGAYSIYDDSNWVGGDVRIPVSSGDHKPIIILRGTDLVRTKIIIASDVVDRPKSVFRAERHKSKTQPVGVGFAGSSTTQGTGATNPSANYVNQLMTLMRLLDSNGGTESTVQASSSASFSKITTPGIHGYNLGEGGTSAANFFTGAERTAVAALNLAALIIMIGANDWAYNMNPATTYKNNLGTVLSDLRTKSPNTMLILVHSYQRMDLSNPTYQWDGYRTAQKELAAAFPESTTFIDASGPFVQQGVPGADPNNLVGTDNLHPTNAGHLLLAQTVFARL